MCSLLNHYCTTFTSSENVLNENTVRTEGIQITIFYNEFYISCQTLLFILKHGLYKWYKHNMNAICVNKILVFRTCLSENCYTLFFYAGSVVYNQNLQKRKNINQKIETFKRFLVMQKLLVKVMHPKIVFVKVETSVIEISESVH